MVLDCARAVVFIVAALKVASHGAATESQLEMNDQRRHELVREFFHGGSGRPARMRDGVEMLDAHCDQLYMDIVRKGVSSYAFTRQNL